MKTISFFLLLLAGTLASAQQNFGFMLQSNGNCSAPPAQYASVCNDAGKFLVFYLPDGTKVSIPDSWPGPQQLVGHTVQASGSMSCKAAKGNVQAGFTCSFTNLLLTVTAVQ